MDVPLTRWHGEHGNRVRGTRGVFTSAHVLAGNAEPISLGGMRHGRFARWFVAAGLLSLLALYIDPFVAAAITAGPPPAPIARLEVPSVPFPPLAVPKLHKPPALRAVSVRTTAPTRAASPAAAAAAPVAAQPQRKSVTRTQRTKVVRRQAQPAAATKTKRTRPVPAVTDTVTRVAVPKTATAATGGTAAAPADPF